MFQNATLASSLATCLRCQSLAMSPIAHTPSADVRMCSSTTIVPWWCRSTPPTSASSRSVFGSRPVATSSSSTSTSWSWQWMTIPVERRSTLAGELAGVEVDALREQLREALGDLVVLHAQHRLRPGEDRHLRSVACEHVAHLGGDEASADDAQPLGKRSSRMIESDVWNPISTSPAIGGIVGRVPAAIRMWSAVIVRPSTSSTLGSTNRACPRSA